MQTKRHVALTNNVENGQKPQNEKRRTDNCACVNLAGDGPKKSYAKHSQSQRNQKYTPTKKRLGGRRKQLAGSAGHSEKRQNAYHSQTQRSHTPNPVFRLLRQPQNFFGFFRLFRRLFQLFCLTLHYLNFMMNCSKPQVPDLQLK